VFGFFWEGWPSIRVPKQPDARITPTAMSQNQHKPPNAKAPNIIVHPYPRPITSVSPSHTYPLRTWPIPCIVRSAPPLGIGTIVPAFPRTVIVDVSSPNISSIWKALFWCLKWKIILSSFGGVIDSLELFVNKVATRSGHESAVATQ
jgi:hypothetical protein